MKISIPEPCSENWNNMTPKEKGRLCGVCSKVVVDFTKMKKDEISKYFASKKNERTCGRFLTSQLDGTEKFKNYERSWLSKFAFAIYMVFGLTLFSCAQNSNQYIIGEVPLHNIDSLRTNIDSLSNNQDTVLSSIDIDSVKVRLPKTDTIKKVMIKDNILIELDEMDIATPTETIIFGLPINEELPLKEVEVEREVIKMGKIIISN